MNQTVSSGDSSPEAPPTGAGAGFALDRALEDLAAAHAELALAHAELGRRQAFADAVMDAVEVGIITCGPDGRDWHRNRAGREILGLNTADELRPEDAAALIDVLDETGRPVPVHDYPVLRALRGENAEAVELRIGPAGGPHREIVSLNRQVRGPDGGLLGAVTALKDVTVERDVARSLEQERHFFDAVLTASPDFTVVTDLSTGAPIWGSRGASILGLTTEQLLALGGKAVAALVHPDDTPRLLAFNAEAAALEDSQVVQLRYRARHVDGTWRWLSRRITPFRRGPNGSVIQVLGVVRDITDVVALEEQLTHAALHDPLTGLPNRALLMDRLEAALERARRNGGDLSLLYCDLDGFKDINDGSGHATGDALLTEVACRMQQEVRTSDTVARVGGDEFVVIVEPWTRPTLREGHAYAPGSDAHAGEMLAKRLAATVSRPVDIDGHAYAVTVSIGLVHLRDLTGRPEADDMLRAADEAMYDAKRAGRKRVSRYLPPSR